MENTVKSVLKTAGAAFALSIGAVGFLGGAIAHASSSHESNADVKVSTTPPTMKLVGSTDEQIRTTGIQGVLEESDQCTDTSTVKVACVTPSPESTPQFKAK